jgi:hypothetical protein
MKRKMIAGLIVLAFVCSSPLLMTSCSKKAVKSWADKAFTRPTSMKKAEAPAEALMGHCDERGTAEYNLALGERRAHAAKKFLSALGISADRIYTVSYGEEKPAEPGHNEAAWSKNRRDGFKLIK